MTAGWATRMRRRARQVLWPGGRGIVLLYHRIADEAADPYGLCVSPAHFEEHLRAIRAGGHPVHLGELASGVRAGRVPDRAVCVTFDDGYADNLEVAKPLLEGYEIPATVFVTTGPGGRHREFWWDELERAFFEPDALPETLEIEVAGGLRSWKLGAGATLTSAERARARGWSMLDERVPTPRHGVFREVYYVAQALPEAERTRLLDQLMAWAGIDPSHLRRTHRALEPDELIALRSGGIVEVGAHTVSHPALPTQPPAVQREEITRSKADVERWVGGEVAGFAYPYGQFDDTSVAAARDAGFAYACSCLFEEAWSGSDPYVLPRVVVPDVPGAALSRRLTEAIGSRRPILAP
jgi:peptidoglycan/xylan/chitin deacetylase (PgdA/CDA1 family)